ncbi:response regulator transcription factor [Pontiellaceae bacterium B12227]|nr:response regulator transcription factor [Pontiellaceae bacterium B12227]
MKSKIRIMVVEDHPEYREVIELSLLEEQDMQLVGAFGAAEVALRSLQSMETRKEADLILLDLHLAGMSGLDAIPFFKKSLPDAKIIILTQSDTEANILQAIQSGAEGYLLKSSSFDEITQGIRTVMQGGAILDQGLARFIIETLKTRPRNEETAIQLTSREKEILTLLGEGLAKKEIADQLGIGVSTVAEFVKRIYIKLNVQNAPAAISKAYKSGILNPD